MKKAFFDKQGTVDKSFIPKEGFAAYGKTSVLHSGNVVPSLSYSQMVRASNPVIDKSRNKSLSVAEVDCSWLLRSGIGKLKSFQSIKVVHKLFSYKGFESVQIRAMGGFYFVITFQTKELLESMLIEEKHFLSSWFTTFRKWDGQFVPPSRYVWLTCFGLPLNV